MRRLALACAPLLAVASAAAAAPPSPISVTIVADSTPIVYGAATSVSGSISDPKGGAKIGVFARPCGRGSFTALTTVESSAGGAWTASVRPTRNTAYEAKFRSAFSDPIAVQVRPSITLAKVRAHRFRVRIAAAESFAGRVAVFQRYRRGRWIRVRRVTLRQIAAYNETVVSGRTFRSGIGRGRLVRLALPQSQAGACYLAGTSSVIRS